MDRQLKSHLKDDLSQKMVLLSGPRQSGKTTLARGLGAHDYLNFDDREHRIRFREKLWDRSVTYLVFDELHKMRAWKRWLKGVYDTEGIPPGVVVTGSARLDTYRKVGDSLAGRYFAYRLHPLDPREVSLLGQMKPADVVDRILEVGGFPEPFLKGTSRFYGRWRRTHLDIILRQDLVDLETAPNIAAIESLVDLLRDRVGSPVSVRSLCEDLQASDKTVRRWLRMLENMYVLFRVTPFHKNIARANRKQAKYYFFDVARVRGKGARLENLVASSLLKECHYRQDVLGEDWALHYVRKAGGAEVDFLIVHDGTPTHLIEVKTSDMTPSKNFRTFASVLPGATKVQVVHRPTHEVSSPHGVHIRDLGPWLSTW